MAGSRSERQVIHYTSRMEKESQGGYRITDIPESERPRERLEHKGAGALADAELLAILLRVGVRGENSVQVGQRLLQTLGGLRGLHTCDFPVLASQFGIGKAKAAQLKAALELGRRISLLQPEERRVIGSPRDVADLLRYEMGALPQEHLRAVLLDTRNRVISVEALYVGTLNASHVRVAEVFKPAIQRNAAAVIIVHNHPSGDPSPSPEDVALTRSLVQAGKLLDVAVLDHVVIGNPQWVSLKERGLGF